MTPIAQPGQMTEIERFMFDAFGYLVIPDALTADEVRACLEAAKRLHGDLPRGEWRQLGAAYEREPAIEPLIDHSSTLP